MSAVRVIVVGAPEFVVKGTLEEVDHRLSEAARSREQFAWFEEEDTDARIGINPTQVAAISIADD